MPPVEEYQVEMDPADLRWFRRNLGTERCFEADLTSGGGRRPIWIGYRGRFSRYCDKPSFDVWFQDRVPSGAGGHLHWNASFYDPSLLRNRLAFELFSALGVPAPAARHVWLAINGQPLGLYTQVESVDGDWLARRGIVQGTIYYGVGGQGNFGLIDRYTGIRKRNLARGYEKCYPHDDDFSDLEALVWQITLPSDAEFEAEIARTVDMEIFLRWLVGVVYISHTDGLAQNYALFRSGDGLWQISPWDCDGTMGRCPDGHRLPADHMPFVGGGGNYLLARLMESPLWRDRYLALWDQLLGRELAPAAVAERLHRIHAEIRPAALQDCRKRLGNQTFLREPARIRRWFAERTAFVTAEMKLMREGAPAR